MGRWLWWWMIIPMTLGAWSLPQLHERAYAHSATVIEITHRIEALQHERRAARMGDPLLIETGVRRLRADESVGSGMAYSVMGTLTLLLPQFIHTTDRYYDQTLRVAQHQLLLEHDRIDRELRYDLWGLEIAQERQNLLQAKVRSAHEAYRMGAKQQQGGRLSTMGLVRLELDRNQALHEYEEAQREYRQWSHRVQALCAIEDERVESMPIPWIRIDATHERLERTHTAQLMRYWIAQVGEQIRWVRASAHSSVGVGLGVTQEPTQESVDLRVSIPLAYNDKNEAKVATLLATQEGWIATERAWYAQTHEALIGIDEQLRHLQEQIQALTRETPRYEALATMAQKGFEGGVISQFEYLATKNGVYEHQLRIVALKQTYIETLRQAEETLGEPL